MSLPTQREEICRRSRALTGPLYRRCVFPPRHPYSSHFQDFVEGRIIQGPPAWEAVFPSPSKKATQDLPGGLEKGCHIGLPHLAKGSSPRTQAQVPHWGLPLSSISCVCVFVFWGGLGEQLLSSVKLLSSKNLRDRFVLG